MLFFSTIDPVFLVFDWFLTILIIGTEKKRVNSNIIINKIFKLIRLAFSSCVLETKSNFFYHFVRVALIFFLFNTHLIKILDTFFNHFKFYLILSIYRLKSDLKVS